MKFKASLLEAKLLLEYLSFLEKLGSTCLFKLDEENVEICMTSDHTNGEQVFISTPHSTFFEKYRIESKDNNEVLFLVGIKNLILALKSGVSASSVTMKLTKQGGQPMLSFQMKTDSFDISQDVAITLQSAKRKIDFDEPVLDAPDVKVAMPELKALVSVIERMKLITDDELVLTASENGNLSLQVEADQVKIKTFYTGNLNRPGAPSMSQQVSQLSQSRNAGKTITQTVDIKKFARILQCRTLSDMAEKFIGCFVGKDAFVLYIQMKKNSGTVTCYLPLIAQPM